MIFKTIKDTGQRNIWKQLRNMELQNGIVKRLGFADNIIRLLAYKKLNW